MKESHTPQEKIIGLWSSEVLPTQSLILNGPFGDQLATISNFPSGREVDCKHVCVGGKREGGTEVISSHQGHMFRSMTEQMANHRPLLFSAHYRLIFCDFSSHLWKSLLETDSLLYVI